MNIITTKKTTESTETKTENVIAGIVGAFLFSLVGGGIWFLLYQIGIIAGLSGLVGVILAIKGYELFAKKGSMKGIILSSVIALLVLVLAWYFCLGKDIYDAYQSWYAEGEVDDTLTFFESMRVAPLFLADPEIGLSYFEDLGFGLLFALVASVSSIAVALRNKKMQKAAQAEAQKDAEVLPDETMPEETVLPEKETDPEENDRP